MQDPTVDKENQMINEVALCNAGSLLQYLLTGEHPHNVCL